MEKYKFYLLIILSFALLSGNPAFSQGNNSISYYNQGVDYYHKGKYQQAVQSFKKAVSLNPKFADAYYNLAVAYDNLGNTNQAIQNYKKALSLNPKNQNIKKILASLYSELGNKNQVKGNYNEAIQNYKTALTYNSKVDWIYYNLGIAYEKNNQTDLAIQSYKKSISLNPKNSNARNNLAVIYYNTGVNLTDRGENQQAIWNFNQVKEVDPNYNDIYCAIANAYISTGEYDLAIQNLEKYLSIYPDDTAARHNLKIAYQMRDEKETAQKINLVTSKVKAPKQIYELSRLETGLQYTTLIKFYDILDILWGDPEGQKLLSIIMKHRIPINVTYGKANTNASIQVRQYKQTITYAGIPVFSFNAGSDKNIEINIGENHIHAFRNSTLTAHERIYALQVVVHELCHAAKNAISKNNDNSISEELSASMIGYNIASRIIKGRDLSPEEASKYSEECLKALLTDDHRFLPAYNKFNEEIQKYGVYPPHLYKYQNIVDVYRVIRDDPETQRLDTLERMLVN